MPFLTDMVLNGWTQKTSTSTKENYCLNNNNCNNFLTEEMPGNKFVERAFLIGGFVGSKSQAGSSPSRAYISLSDVIFEQLLNLRLNLCTTLISSNCQPQENNMIKTNVQPTFNSNKSKNFHHHYHQQKNPKFNDKNSKKEELIYEDKDEGGNKILIYQEVQKSTCEVTKTSMFHVRSRTISDCSIESDDSFIIFENNDDSEHDLVSDDDLIESEDDDCSISSDDDTDESIMLDEIDKIPIVDYSFVDEISPKVQEANNKWNKIDFSKISTGKSKLKKVTFANDKQLINTRVMCTWDYAHRAARKGPWEILALDTCRFKTKIQELSNIITPILSPDHRKRIFEHRFQTFLQPTSTISPSLSMK